MTEIILKSLSRRSLIAGASICSVVSLIRWRSIGAEAIHHASIIPDDGFLHGCLFAATSGKCSPCDQSASLVDFWTFRVSEIDISSLPAYVGRTVIWDDVFSSRSLTGSIGAMLGAVKDWYGFDPCEGQCSFHVDGLDEIESHVRAAISQRQAPRSHRLAVIDVSSCGLSRIDWPDVLPHMRSSYDALVGFVHTPGRESVLCEAVAEVPRIGYALAGCDHSLWTDDKMLGLNEGTDCSARAQPLNALVQDLVRALSADASTLGLEKIAGHGSLLEGRLLIAPQAIALRSL